MMGYTATMQTFLPYSDFAKSASVLDQRRLGKQRVETMQIMQALVGGSRWSCHPAVKMWTGYETSLMQYQLAVCQEWTKVRGFKDTCLGKTFDILGTDLATLLDQEVTQPYWLGDYDFHRAHRSNLVRKVPELYGGLWSDVPVDLDYIWPAPIVAV